MTDGAHGYIHLKGRGPPRFSCRRYQQILDLLATMIPTAKVTEVTKTLFLIGSKYPLLGAGADPLRAMLAARHSSNVG
ncbi:hypothetical protein Y032_0007g3497 [Ancylostoma ceylanicum]|uniref:Uncharacterized protein n=1 Tax=Ancylostoma ceylanicum TaxID=53326 RepID=A0A016VNB8_9BILA|nr:hypothetical protein Y032_0007g3497 [Ancylostoma ceylanicum]